jgi:glycosyltransferase involved in cell wall biosynthesis
MPDTANRITLLTNIPAPYRVATWNRLARLTGGKAKVLFIAPTESRRNWTVPAERMNFDWQFLSRRPDPHQRSTQAASAAAMLLHLFRERPQTIICGGYDSVAAWICFLWCKLLGKRFVLWLESTARDSRKPGLLKRRFKRWIVSGADAIAAAGSATVEYVRGLGARRDRIYIAPFGGDVQFFSRQSRSFDAAREKRRLGLPPRLILYSGRLVRGKGIFVLLEAFRVVSAELGDAGMLVVGHGPDQEAMRRHARRLGLQSIHFLGPQPYACMPRYYALADVLALPTFSDQWGFVVNEAFACGVPAVVSRVAGVCDDLIVEGETGFTVEPGNASQLAGRILRILRNPELRARMSENCLRLVRKYSADACAEGLLAAASGQRT